MEVRLCLGGIHFLFRAENDLEINEELFPFLVQNEERTDLVVQISRDWGNVRLPETEKSGQDAILEYYVESDARYCIARGGYKGALACTCYSPDFRHITCVINDTPFLYPIRKMGSILRMLPMREIFLYFSTLFFHASRISYEGKGILFSARSGTGKSTQAKLWKKYRNAEIICNDRTLLRKSRGKWYSYGYPLDGSEPVCSGRVKLLGCIALLEQGIANEVYRLRPGKAISLLLEQVVMDCWSEEERMKAMELIIQLLQDIPVYRLVCTPDRRAVEVLEAKLIEDEVISDGKSF